jgi:hypothetical protein
MAIGLAKSIVPNKANTKVSIIVFISQNVLGVLNIMQRWRKVTSELTNMPIPFFTTFAPL